MTKNVRIENADGSDYQVQVEVWEKGYPAGIAPDQLVRTVNLQFPTHMENICITSTRWLVVKELPVPLKVPAPK